jgi:phospholipid-transporting ATPase
MSLPRYCYMIKEEYPKKTIPLTIDNLVLRGMSIRNTESMIGLVVYTGHQTKI